MKLDRIHPNTLYALWALVIDLYIELHVDGLVGSGTKSAISRVSLYICSDQGNLDQGVNSKEDFCGLNLTPLYMLTITDLDMLFIEIRL